MLLLLIISDSCWVFHPCLGYLQHFFIPIPMNFIFLQLCECEFLSQFCDVAKVAIIHKNIDFGFKWDMKVRKFKASFYIFWLPTRKNHRNLVILHCSFLKKFGNWTLPKPRLNWDGFSKNTETNSIMFHYINWQWFIRFETNLVLVFV